MFFVWWKPVSGIRCTVYGERYRVHQKVYRPFTVCGVTNLFCTLFNFIWVHTVLSTKLYHHFKLFVWLFICIHVNIVCLTNNFFNVKFGDGTGMDPTLDTVDHIQHFWSWFRSTTSTTLLLLLLLWLFLFICIGRLRGSSKVEVILCALHTLLIIDDRTVSSHYATRV